MQVVDLVCLVVISLEVADSCVQPLALKGKKLGNFGNFWWLWVVILLGLCEHFVRTLLSQLPWLHLRHHQ